MRGLYLCTVSSTSKTLIGLATFLPLVLLVLYVLSLIPGGFTGASSPQDDAQNLPIGIMSLGVSLMLIMAFVLSSIALFVYYLVHVINNKRLESSTRLLWSLIILLFTNIGFILYWYFQIWREDDDRISHTYRN